MENFVAYMKVLVPRQYRFIVDVTKNVSEKIMFLTPKGRAHL